MKYYFDLIKADSDHEKIHNGNGSYEYYTKYEIENIELHELECTEDEFWNESKYDNYWCLYDCCSYSNEFYDFKTKEEAVDMLERCLNLRVFEIINDI